MNRYQKSKPQLIQPKKKIELSKKDKLLRFIVMIILLIIGFIFIGIGMKNCLNSSSGWQVISYTDNYNTGITLYYNLGSSEKSATAENKELSIVYNNYLTEAYFKYNSWINNSDEVTSNTMYNINNNINNPITIDKTLYEALQKVLNSNNKRLIYLAPIYALYEELLMANDDIQAENLDPYLNSKQKQIYDTFMSYLSSDDHVKLELLDNYQVKLYVSDTYYSYCNDFFETPVFIDFCYLTNAFIVDEVADKLISDGYNSGMLYSNDGYQRIFVNDIQVNLPIYEYNNGDIKLVTRVGFSTNQTIVTFKNYPSNDNEYRYSYIYEDNTRRSNIINDNNYSNTTWVDYLTMHSDNKSCVDIALEMINIYINNNINQTKLDNLKQNNIYYIYMKDYLIHYNNPNITYNDTDSYYRYDKILDK